MGPIPRDTPRDGHEPYQIRVFDSPFELRSAIEERALTFDDKSGEMVDDTSHGLSRMLATYDWPYSSKSHPAFGGAWEVRIVREESHWVSLGQDGHRQDSQSDTGEADSSECFHIPWNYQTVQTPEEARRDKGKAWAEQSHTLGECGSIYTIQGFDLNYAGVIIGPSVCWRDGHLVFDPTKSCNSQAINGSERPEDNLRHELNVLLKRGVHGLYLFAVDEGLERRLLDMQLAGSEG